MPRPTLPVWAINLSARAEPDHVEALLNASERVLDAHRLVLGGANRDVLLEANQALSTALEDATSSAARHAAAAGHPLSTNMLGRVRTTLRALAFGDAEGRERLRAGRVLAEATGTGLDSLEALSPLGSRASVRSDRRPKRERQREEKERERALAAARREAQAAERDLARASAVVARLRHEAEDAQARANEKKQQSRDAEGELAQVARRVENVRRRVAELEGGSPA